MKNNKQETASRKIVGAVFIILIIAIACFLFVKLNELRNVKDTYDRIEEAAGSREKFRDMMKENPEIIAWLTVDGTMIDTPVTHTADNIKYVSVNAQEEPSLGGNPFLDHRNKTDFSDLYSVVYGHNMEEHLAFGDLMLFEDQDFWTEERTGTLTLSDMTELSITFFAFIEADADDIRYFDPRYIENNCEEDGFLDDVLADAAVKLDGINPDEHIIALSTCLTADSDDRILVLGKITER